MDQERRPEVEAEPTKQPTLTGEHEHSAHASTASFTQQGAIPAVQEDAHPVQPSASDRAYGKGHGKAKSGGHYDMSGTVNSEVRRNVDGVTIIAPAGVHVSALERAAEIVRLEVGRNQFAQRQFAASRATIVIIPPSLHMTDLGQFQHMQGQKTFDGRPWETVRGIGGTPAPDGSFCIGVAEENLIQIKNVVSGYAAGYSIGMHELAHALETKGMTPAQRDRLRSLFALQQQQDQRNRTTHHDAFTDNYAASNEQEYFAQATNAFFNRNVGTENEGSGKHKRTVDNHNGRLWLYKNDPDMYQFLVEMYETSYDGQGQRTDAPAR